MKHGTTFDTGALIALEPRGQRALKVLESRWMPNAASAISVALGTAEATVKNQASCLFRKLGVRDRTRAVLRALELGIL